MKPRSRLSKCCSSFFTGVSAVASATEMAVGAALTTSGAMSLITGNGPIDKILNQELTFHNLLIPLGDDDPILVPYMKMVLGDGFNAQQKNAIYMATTFVGCYLIQQGLSQANLTSEAWKRRKEAEKDDYVNVEIVTVERSKTATASAASDLELGTIHIERAADATAYQKLDESDKVTSTSPKARA